MFIDDIRIILNSDSVPDYKKSLLQQYADSFKKSSGAISEWATRIDCGTEIQNEAWNLFCEYCRTELELAISNGKKDVCEQDNSQSLVKGFLSVLFPGKDYYADEINLRLNYIAKRAFDAAWSKNSDPYSPMDRVDSFRQMLGFHLEQTSDIDRSFWEKSHGNDAYSSIQTQLMEIVYDISRYSPGQREYKQLERLYDSALGVLKRIGRNTARDVQSQVKFISAWEIRAAMKDHVQLTNHVLTIRKTNLNWKDIHSLLNAYRENQRTRREKELVSGKDKER